MDMMLAQAVCKYSRVNKATLNPQEMGAKVQVLPLANPGINFQISYLNASSFLKFCPPGSPRLRKKLMSVNNSSLTNTI